MTWISIRRPARRSSGCASSAGSRPRRRPTRRTRSKLVRASQPPGALHAHRVRYGGLLRCGREFRRPVREAGARIDYFRYNRSGDGHCLWIPGVRRTGCCRSSKMRWPDSPPPAASRENGSDHSRHRPRDPHDRLRCDPDRIGFAFRDSRLRHHREFGPAAAYGVSAPSCRRHSGAGRRVHARTMRRSRTRSSARTLRPQSSSAWRAGAILAALAEAAVRFTLMRRVRPSAPPSAAARRRRNRSP